MRLVLPFPQCGSDPGSFNSLLSKPLRATASGCQAGLSKGGGLYLATVAIPKLVFLVYSYFAPVSKGRP